MTPTRSSVQVFLAFLLILAVSLSGCAGSAPAAQPAPASQAVLEAPLSLPLNIDPATTDRIRQRDDVVILDVREQWEYDGGHVPGAQLIPLGQLASRLNELPKDQTVVAVCRSGNRSSQATEFLRQQGYDVHNMQGGMIQWAEAGLPVEK